MPGPLRSRNRPIGESGRSGASSWIGRAGVARRGQHRLADALLLVRLGVRGDQPEGRGVPGIASSRSATAMPTWSTAVTLCSAMPECSSEAADVRLCGASRLWRCRGRRCGRSRGYRRTTPAIAAAGGPMSGSVIVAGARTPMGRLLGSLKGFSGAQLGGVAIKAALERAGRGPGPGPVRDHGPGAAPPAPGRSRPGRPRSAGRHPDGRPGAHDQQGVPVRPRRHRAGRPAHPGRRVRHRRGRRPGVDDPGAAPARQVAARASSTAT